MATQHAIPSSARRVEAPNRSLATALCVALVVAVIGLVAWHARSGAVSPRIANPEVTGVPRPVEFLFGWPHWLALHQIGTVIMMAALVVAILEEELADVRREIVTAHGAVIGEVRIVFVGLHREQDPLDPGCPADRGGRGPAEQLDQPVVAAAAAEPRLGAEPIAGELEDRPVVVVKAADERAIERVGDARLVEQTPDRSEMLRVLAGEAVEHLRRVLHHCPRPCVIGVEGAHRVRVDALADLVKKGLVTPEEAVLRAVDKAGLENLLKRR